MPDGVMMKQRMDNQDYIEQLRNTVADAIAAGFNLGRDSTKPTLAQQSWMASALNAAGYNNPKWCRLLNDENKVNIQEEVRLQVDQDDNDAIICDIMKRIITKNPPKAPHLLSGILASGGITKGFTTRLELCKHIFAKYGDRWDKNVMYRTESGERKMPYKRKNCLAPDIQGHPHNIGQLCMGKETYAVYDAPHDGSCFYHAYSMMVRPHLRIRHHQPVH